MEGSQAMEGNRIHAEIMQLPLAGLSLNLPHGK
jgi:hypothetical protein